MRTFTLLLLIGCGGMVAGGRSPVSPLDRFGTYKNVVEYEVDPLRVKGEACSAVRDDQDTKSLDKGAITNGYLYEKAKIAALDTAKDADGLIEVRGLFTLDSGGNECVTISGRPYRVRSMKAVPPIESESEKPAVNWKPAGQ